jgi:hypothetical protein
MADDKTNNPNTFTINQEDLNKAPAQAQPNNPLNTGNGNQVTPVQSEPIAPAEPATETVDSPHEIKIPTQAETQATTEASEKTQEELDKKLEEQLINASSEKPEETKENPNNKKKYLIASIAGLAILVAGFIIYRYAFADNSNTQSEDAETPKTTNTLSEPEDSESNSPIMNIDLSDEETMTDEETLTDEDSSDKMKELEEVVEDLNELYSETADEIYEEPILEEIDQDDEIPSFSLPSGENIEKENAEEETKVLR